MARACTLSRPWDTAMVVLGLQPASPGPLGVGVWPRLWSAQKLGVDIRAGSRQWRLPTSGADGPLPSLCWMGLGVLGDHGEAFFHQPLVGRPGLGRAPLGPPGGKARAGGGMLGWLRCVHPPC